MISFNVTNVIICIILFLVIYFGAILITNRINKTISEGKNWGLGIISAFSILSIIRNGFAIDIIITLLISIAIPLTLMHLYSNQITEFIDKINNKN